MEFGDTHLSSSSRWGYHHTTWCNLTNTTSHREKCRVYRWTPAIKLAWDGSLHLGWVPSSGCHKGKRFAVYMVGADLLTTPGSAALWYLCRRLYGAAKKNVRHIKGPLVIVQVMVIAYNSNLYLVKYILITFTIVACGCGGIFWSANLAEVLVVVKFLLCNNPHQMLHMDHGGILSAKRANTRGPI